MAPATQCVRHLKLQKGTHSRVSRPCHLRRSRLLRTLKPFSQFPVGSFMLVPEGFRAGNSVGRSVGRCPTITHSVAAAGTPPQRVQTICFGADDLAVARTSRSEVTTKSRNLSFEHKCPDDARQITLNNPLIATQLTLPSEKHSYRSTSFQNLNIFFYFLIVCLEEMYL